MMKARLWISHKWLKAVGLIVPAALVLGACSAPAPTQAIIPQTGPQSTGTPTLLVVQAPPTQTAPTQIFLDNTPAVPTVTPAAASPAAACTNPAALTPAMTEGPYFKAGSSQRASLVDVGMSGTRLTLSGTVFNADCQPVANAKLDFRQADAQGQYDNAGYTLRGYVLTDAAGHYRIDTIVPGEYPGRTEHIHVKVQAPGGPLLTTQLFFPGVPGNQSDAIFDPKLLVSVQQNGSAEAASYNFVIGVK
jgi:protocatechuate 3,4-dioxygenase beta subunit